MNILRKHAPLINFFQRILDVAILLFVTWLVEKWLGLTELMRILAIYGSLLLAIIFSLFDIYKSWRSIPLVNQIKSLLFAWIFVLIIFNILILLLSNKEQIAILWPYCLFCYEEFDLWALFVFLGLAVVRVVAKSFLIFIRGKGYNQRQAVIAGAGEAGTKIAKHLEENKWMGIKFIGFFDDCVAEGGIIKASAKILGSVLGPVDKCPDFALKKNIDMVFIALPMRYENKINKLIWNLGTKGVEAFFIPDLFTLGIQRAKVSPFGELHLMDFNIYPAWKRPFDILFSLAIILLSLPVWLVIIILIKVEDGGPILYKHPRIRESGKRFNCLKFRTMYIDADRRLGSLLEENSTFRKEWEQTYKIKNDPRVTKVGKFLRKTSLDELPQFINVLAGDMSVVGARPVVSEELEKYYKDTALTYCATKPGVTGPWQCGKRSDTENYDERVNLDKWYVLNCSLWLDIRIIFRTIWRVIFPRGAY